MYLLIGIWGSSHAVPMSDRQSRGTAVDSVIEAW